MLSQTTNGVPRQVFTWALRQETWLHRRLQRAALGAAQDANLAEVAMAAFAFLHHLDAALQLIPNRRAERA